MPSWRSSASSRSSCMKSDCIMSWSWLRWPGDMLESSDCIWPACWAICSRSWSRFWAPGKWSPHFCLKASKSGSRPSARSWSMRLRSRIISRIRSRSWGVMLPSCLLHVGEERLQHLLLQALHQLPEHAVRVGIHELVVLQALDAPGGGLRHLVERLPVLGGRLLHALAERLGSFALLGALLGVAHPPLDALALGLQDVVELLLDVVEHRGEIVAVELLLALPAQAVEQILKPGQVGPVRVLARRAGRAAGARSTDRRPTGDRRTSRRGADRRRGRRGAGSRPSASTSSAATLGPHATR